MPKKTLAHWDAYVQVNLGKKSSKDIAWEIVSDGYSEQDALSTIALQSGRRRRTANQIIFWGSIFLAIGALACVVGFERGDIDVVWGILCVACGTVAFGIGVRRRLLASES